MGKEQDDLGRRFQSQYVRIAVQMVAECSSAAWETNDSLIVVYRLFLDSETLGSRTGQQAKMNKFMLEEYIPICTCLFDLHMASACTSSLGMSLEL
jgi:hypothetical protein